MQPWGYSRLPAKALRQPASGRSAVRRLPTNHSQYSAHVIYSPLGDDFVIELGLLADEEGVVLQNYRQVFVMSSAMFVLLSFLLGGVMASRVLRVVLNVTETARIIAEGSWGLRVPKGNRQDEVADLADAFNDMIQRIQKLVAELRDVTDDIAHDLRTPIARMRAAAESSLDDPAASEEARELAGSVLEECDRLLQLINTMLEISQMEAGARPFDRQTLDLAELAEDVFELFRPAAEDKGIDVRTELSGPLVVSGDRQRLMRAVAHIVDNAVKYTEPGGEIRISCARRNGKAEVTVSDTGIGIAESDLSRVFDRFYRADQSRAGTGHGLGLSAARAICVAHGGAVTVASAPAEGSSVSISIPAE